MLRSIRNNSKGTVAKIIIAAILIIFALGGLSTCENREVSPLKVNGDSVDRNELLLEMQIIRNQMLSNMGDEVDFDQLSEEKILPLAINRLTEQLLISQTLDEMMMTIPDGMVENIIFNNPSFQENGVFSNQLLVNFINNQGITLPLLKKRITNDLNRSQLTSGIGLSHFSLPSSEKIFLEIFNERRNVNLLKLPFDDFFDNSTASVDELELFYEKNKADFKSELQVVVEYIDFKLEDLYKPVSDQEILSEYEIQTKQFVSEESREVSHIFLEINDLQNDEQVLSKLSFINERLAKGELFSDMALEFSQDPSTAEAGGYLGFIQKGGGFPDSFEDTVFSMEVGDISSPVKTETGYHIIKLISSEISSLGSLDSLKDEIEEQLMIRKAKLEYINLLEDAGDISFNAIDLIGPAEMLGMKTTISSPIAKSDSSIKPLDDTDDILRNKKVVSAIFSDDVLIDGLNSELLELSETRSVLLRAKDVLQPRQLSLDEVRDEISLIVKTEKTKAKIKEIVKNINTDVSSGISFTKAIKAKDYKLEDFVLSRTSVDLDQELLNDIFQKSRLEPDSKVHEFIVSAGDFYLYQIKEIFKDDEAEDKSIVALNRQLRGVGAQQEINNFMTSVQLNSDIEVK